MKNKLYYGCAYYPELWEEAEVEKDIVHMKALGINVVRMGEFAWSFLEPEENEFQADYFVKISNRLYDNGIETILCTPTATPPVWMTYGHPERLFHRENGERLGHGSRQHCCINQDYFRDRTVRIVREIAGASRKMRGLIGWQIDNELKCHVAECHCPSCVEQWHVWLQQEYGSVERLNEAWGTGVWSESYRQFDQVPAPGPTPFLHNASLVQEYKRFSREKATEFVGLQAEVIRQYSEYPITHNTGEYFALDNPALFQELDFASFDDYAEAEQYPVMLRSYDYFRAMKPGVPFWVMETSPNHNGCLLGTAKPHPHGYLKAEAASAYICGAQGFSYWLFRQQRAGSEMPHGSVLYAWGEPTSGYEEVRAAGLVRQKLEPYLMESAVPKGRVALLYSDLARITFESEPLEQYDYWKMIQSVYEDDIPHDVQCDVIHEGVELAGYEILYTPFQAAVSDAFLEKAASFVRSGGVWIAGPMSGYRTEKHTVPTSGGFGKLEQLAGARVKYLQSFTGCGIHGQLLGRETELSMLGAVLEPVSAEVLGRITAGFAAGEAFATVKEIGSGKLVLLGARPALGKEAAWGRELLQQCLKPENAPLWESETGIKTIVRCTADGRRYLFAVDMEGKGGTLRIDTRYEVLFGEKTAGGVRLEPYETVLAVII